MKTHLPVLVTVWLVLSALICGATWISWSFLEGPHIRGLVSMGIPMRPDDWFLWLMWGYGPLYGVVASMVLAALIMSFAWGVVFRKNG